MIVTVARSEPGSRPGTIPVFVLCGGLGTRLAGVERRPKAIIPVAGLPFLAYSLRLLRLQGFRRVVFCLGTGAAEIQVACDAGGGLRPFAAPLEIAWSVESEPLGTGGALGLASAHARSTNLILNGDSYAEVVYADLRREHRRHGTAARSSATLLAVRADDAGDYGSLEIDGEGRVTRFLEKGARGSGWINAGVYVAGGSLLRGLPDGRYSLEREILPALAEQGKLRARRGRFFFRDIGTPDRLKVAQSEFRWIVNRMEPEGEPGGMGEGGAVRRVARRR